MCHGLFLIEGGWKRPVFAVPGGDTALIPATEEKRKGSDPSKRPSLGHRLFTHLWVLRGMAQALVQLSLQRVSRREEPDRAHGQSEAWKSLEALHLFFFGDLALVCGSSPGLVVF